MCPIVNLNGENNEIIVINIIVSRSFLIHSAHTGTFLLSWYQEVDAYVD